MFRSAFRLLWAAIAALAVLQLASPAAAAPAPRRVALLIGNWDYDLNRKFDPDPPPGYVRDLRNPCRDTELVKGKLARAGFEISEYCNATRETFSSAVKAFGDLTSGLPPGSIVFIYYSGHGMQFHGHAFTIPVMFKWDHDAIDRAPDADQLKFFKDNTNEIAALFDRLSGDKNIALVVALDNCREDPVTEKAAYNEAVSIRTPPNAIVQYATTANDLAPDGKGDNSDYALILADQLSKGGDIGDIMSQVGVRIWKKYDSDERDTYAETDVGPAFQALRFTPLTVGQADKTTAATSAVVRRKTVVRNVYDGVSLDILVCEGPGEAERFEFARTLANKISARSHEFGVGRIQLKPLSENINAHGGYNVYRNLMRYDVSEPKERPVLVNIAKAFPEGNFLPQRGVGVGNKPTVNYVSAFICGRVAD